ncbi:MAG: glycosyltransferase family 39 protein [Patescibacteria group bacterium]|nr:glycosyltransferase family 39 protein [Patescibacteria group bacterium]
MLNFFKKHLFALLLSAIILGVLIFSLPTLTTKPQLWTDEALNIELARNFLSYGRLGLVVEPGVFSDVPFLLQSTGYPLTIALAAVFKIFGFGLAQARLFVLALMIILLVLVYWFAKKLFGKTQALWATLLIATFAPFYGDGRCVTGEISGFIFLIFGLYFLFYPPEQNDHLKIFNPRQFLAGIFLGLAIVTKPSVYLMLLPAVFITLFFLKRRFYSRAFNVLIGLAPAAFFWLILNVPNFLAKEPWLKIINYYKNPFAPLSVSGNVFLNFAGLPHNTTLIYFFVLLAIIFWAVLKRDVFLKPHQGLLFFFASYGALALIYFFKSPGWLRYLIAVELFTFIILGPALKAILSSLNFKNYWFGNKANLLGAALLFLAAFQTWHLFNGADLFYSDTPERVAEFVQSRSLGKTVGIYNALTIACLISPEKKFQMIDIMLGLPVLGKDFLAAEENKWPDFIVSSPEEALFISHKSAIKKKYELVYSNGGYDVFYLKSERNKLK